MHSSVNWGGVRGGGTGWGPSRLCYSQWEDSYSMG